MKKLLVVLFAWLSATANAQGNNCDCQQIVGTCSVSVSVIPTESKKGSYGADLKFTSSAPICSKVDYYVDGTPYFTILSQGNHGEDRVFGQKPITRANLSDVSCRVCKRAGGASPEKQPGDAGQTQVPEASLAGRWLMTVSCSWTLSDEPFEVVDSGGGQYAPRGSIGNGDIQGGSIGRGEFHVVTKHWSNIGDYVGRLTSDTTAAGEMRQNATAEVCRWTARKS
ncbi:hypothetical protein [Pandoraea faecigallinarum]|uniref:Uncharacterized protein n=1 Tax=Pandoraea faecigallinarum TaxID=656179 RepID=A0A173GZY0_9BURK|nr:hypothetical protein [Pandoraea faecigallinarum]